MIRDIFRFIKHQSTSRIIVLSFFLSIILGSLLLYLPFSHNEKMSYLDALFLSVSSICVTGLSSIDIASGLTAFGKTVLIILVQIGGLGVMVIGSAIIIAIGKKVDFKSRSILKDALNLDANKGIVNFVKDIAFMVFTIEGLGALINFIVFSEYYSFGKALLYSIFHSISSFNNAGFTIFRDTESLLRFSDSILLNLNTSLLIVLGGLGFLVIKELFVKHFSFKRLSMHSKIVCVMTVSLIILGTVIIKLTTPSLTILEALFMSVSSRTAGFNTISMPILNISTLIVIMVLMFVGASPGSTGGGIKTTTLFALYVGVKSIALEKSEKAFKYRMPEDAFRRASIITFISLNLVVIGTFLLTIFEKNIKLVEALFEVVSAFGTVGLSLGITSTLNSFSKVLLMILMFIGRVGTLSVMSLWNFRKTERVLYPEGNIMIG